MSLAGRANIRIARRKIFLPSALMAKRAAARLRISPRMTESDSTGFLFCRRSRHNLQMDLPAFIAAAGRRTRFTSTHRDPLKAALNFLDEHGETSEGQALRKMLKALAVMHGEFAESELILFSTETLTLVKALADARMEGRYAEADWLDL